MPGLVRDMFDRFESRQAGFFDQLPKYDKEKFAELENKYALLTVTGPEGGVFYLRYRNRRFQIVDEPPPVPYEKLDKFLLDGDMMNYPSGDQVLFDVVSGSLSPRAAISHKFFRGNTERIIFDTEGIAQAFEDFLERMRAVLG